MGNRPHRWLTTVGAFSAAAAMLAVSACGNSDDSNDAGDDGGGESKGTIQIGWINWDEDVAVSNVWKQVLEDQGYTVEMGGDNNFGSNVAGVFQGAADGDVDLFFDTWLPNTHKAYWDEFGDQVTELGTWYDTADLMIAVPSSVEDVNSIPDLVEHADEFDNQIVGIEGGAGEMGIMHDSVLPTYDPDGTLELADGSTATMLEALDTAVSQGKPVAVTLWRPHWAFNAYDIKALDDPDDAFGDPDHLVTIGSQDFASENPEVADWLSNFHLDADQLGDLENRIQEAGDGGLDDAVSSWISDNQDVVDSWISGGASQ